jgi:threonine dehydrogenase-like Zn-dependent dehydrogenase
LRGVKMTTEGIALVAPSGEPPDGSVRVNVVASGICGSDLHMASFGPSWAILGHEFCGTLDDGTPVAVLPVVHCGTCDRRGAPVPERARRHVRRESRRGPG